MDFKVHEAACITRHQHGVQGAFVQRSPFAEALTLSWKQARANSSMRKDMLPARDSKSSLDNLPGCPLLSLNTIAHRVLTQLKHSLLFAETIKMGYLLVGEHVSLIGPLLLDLQITYWTQENILWCTKIGVWAGWWTSKRGNHSVSSWKSLHEGPQCKMSSSSYANGPFWDASERDSTFFVSVQWISSLRRTQNNFTMALW